MLFYVVAAWEDDFTGYVVDYGSFPDQKRPYFTLRDARHTLATEGTGLEGSLYAGMEKLTTDLLGREWQRDDGAAMKIERCLIDANWGHSTNVVYQFCRQSPHASILLPSHGRFVGASSSPFSEYKRRPGDRVGLNWRVPSVHGKRAIRHVIYDTNWWKSFTHARLAVAMGDRGCLSIFGDRAEQHRMFGITAASSIGKSVADTRELYKELQKAGGIAGKTAEEMEGGLGGAFRILKSSIEGVAIAIGESLEGSVTTMVQAFSRAASGVIEWINKNQKIVKIAAASAVAIFTIGAALFALGSFAAVASFAVGGLASIFSFIGASIGVIVSAVGLLFTPLGLVVAAVAALGGYFLYSTGIAGQAVEYLKGVFETLKADTLAAFGAIANALAAGDITAATDVLWTYLKLQWVKGTTYIKGLWADFTQYISDVWADSAYAIGDVLIGAL